MSIFVIVTSEICPACKQIKRKTQEGTSLLDKIKSWVKPYVSQIVEVTMKHNGDIGALDKTHKGLRKVVRNLPGFFIFPLSAWNQGGDLPNNMYLGRDEAGFKEWARKSVPAPNQAKQDYFTKPAVPQEMASAGSYTIRRISITE